MGISGPHGAGGSHGSGGPQPGAAPQGMGLLSADPAEPGIPILRWSSRTHSIAGVQVDLERIWSSLSLFAPMGDGDAQRPERRVAARTSVMNLVVVASRGETGEHAAAVVHGLTGRHPSRTIIVSPADPDGPSWLDAQVQAHCLMPTADSPETCAELVYLTVGGESGQHLAGLISPLLVHDLPVTVWWAGEPRFESTAAKDLLTLADRVLVDGASWAGDGLERLAVLARMPGDYGVAVCDFALLRQSRWREAIASSFDLPRLLPFLGGIRSVVIRYGARPGSGRATNVVKPIYHLAWLASRLGMSVVEPLRATDDAWGGYRGLLRVGGRHVAVALEPLESGLAGGTTHEVEIEARRGTHLLQARITGQADGITVATTVDGVTLPDRHYFVPRRLESELLAETIEDAGAHPITAAALTMAAALTGRPVPGHRSSRAA